MFVLSYISVVYILQDSPSSKLLYAKDIPRYRRLVADFYQSVRQLPAVTDKDIAVIMSEHSTVGRAK